MFTAFITSGSHSRFPSWHLDYFGMSPSKTVEFHGGKAVFYICTFDGFLKETFLSWTSSTWKLYLLES